MENKQANGRPWTWTPPPAMNWMMATTLRLPLLHRLVSKMLLLISFTGKKSGKHYITPVGYHRDGNTITILTKRFRQWWHNFEESAPVVLRIEGRNYAGQAAALTNIETLIPIIAHIVEAHRREAEIYEIKLLDNGKPDLDSVRELAPKVVIIQVTLNPEQGTL
ncbi:MAG: nitroreductase family deazaflavin-dependent oxidoreductase [Anaerolineae bacterium]|nr:nitroreductase family deazaflavin-dependent oxidoreductase [Anaerolineae bacterium]